jgi:hypothetical protein
MALKTAAESFAVRIVPERAAKTGCAIVFKPLPSHDVILSGAKDLGSIFGPILPMEINQRCFAPLNMTALCKGGVFTD